MTTPAVPVKAEIASGSRLEDLFALYAQLKPSADEIAMRLKSVTDAIKVELTAAHPGVPIIDIEHEALPVPLRLSYVESWRVDARKLKAEDPETYVRYATKSGAWQLRGAR